VTDLKLLINIYEALQSEQSDFDLQTAVIALMRSEAKTLATQSDTNMIAQQHPLGFLACRWLLGNGQTLRLHLWSKEFGWAQEPGWEIHNHVFSFSSRILLGVLITEPPCGVHTVYEVTYNDSESRMTPIRRGGVMRLISSSIESVGARYSMEVGVFHSSELISDRALTVLATYADDASQIVPRVISTHQRESISFDRSSMSKTIVSNLLSEFAIHVESGANQSQHA
jgi:hypothetical protein